MQEISLARVTGSVAIFNVDEVITPDILIKPMSFLHMTHSHTKSMSLQNPIYKHSSIVISIFGFWKMSTEDISTVQLIVSNW